MKFFKYIFWFLWRIWFYVMMLIPILIMSPLLFISSIYEKWYKYFFLLAKIWAKCVLFGTGFYYKKQIDEYPVKGKSYMFVANHTSMTDIMLMLAIIDNPFVFVGKASLAKIPLFGFFYKRTCILVDRSSHKSRIEVFKRAQKRLEQGLSICIFPEGGVPDDQSILLDSFKDGAFKLAIDHQIPVVPISFGDNKERMSYTFFSGSMGIMRAKVHSFVATAGKTQNDKKEISDSVRSLIYNQLVRFAASKYDF
jgi:1-acyl-sn-glycerol-3-phosphate acyltransferase